MASALVQILVNVPEVAVSKVVEPKRVTELGNVTGTADLTCRLSMIGRSCRLRHTIVFLRLTSQVLVQSSLTIEVKTMTVAFQRLPRVPSLQVVPQRAEVRKGSSTTVVGAGKRAVASIVGCPQMFQPERPKCGELLSATLEVHCGPARMVMNDM